MTLAARAPRTGHRYATVAPDDVAEDEPRTPRGWWRLALLLVGALVFVFPFYYMIVGSLQKTQNQSLSGALPQPGNLTLHNYGEVNAALDLGRALINSGIFTGGVLLATVIFGVLAGYALAQLHFRGRSLLFVMMLLLLMVPFQLLIIPLYVLIVRNYGLGNSYLGMIAPFAINSTAVFIFRQYFLQLPKELFDAARIDGANELRILTRIALPLVRPALLTAMLLTFIGPWNEYLWPFLITKQQRMEPLAVALANYMNTVQSTVANPFGTILAGAFVLAVPAVVLFLAFQRYFIRAQYRLRRERLIGMAQIVLDRVDKTYPGGTKAVNGLSLEIPDGEFMVLVGPSGCGKTTALRMIAGLEQITRGTIRIGDRVMNHVAPKDRDIAMVFQNYALYPSMTVAQNLAFGLRMRKTPKPEINRRVRDAASILGLEPYLERKPAALSGGQRQRVAMGRAIVREPEVSSWTNRCRTSTPSSAWSMRTSLAEMHERLKVTTVYVTHDQVEAMTLGTGSACSATACCSRSTRRRTCSTIPSTSLSAASSARPR